MKFKVMKSIFEVGQKYRILDVEVWWDKSKYTGKGEPHKDEQFVNGEVVEVKPIELDGSLCFSCGDTYSQDIYSLINDSDEWHDSCIELITEDSTESEDTISIYHIADVLEDAINEKHLWYDEDVQNLVESVKKCIESLRKGVY